ncbi:MAG: LysE family translocator [Endomicrobia bacterium]|nr:LysE family translocator [Endomicrobiia bacterium]MCX7940645.1 LysE family translocator [Endomicrobiia bacterium]MDW8056379.1 LysE family transporter [Elusimicrobiota bacterium]
MNFILFTLSTIVISLSGVMSPGPLTAVAISKGTKDKTAGIFISIGHGSVEILLIILIYLGIYHFLKSQLVISLTSFLGGLFLITLGISMLVRGEQSTVLQNTNDYNNIVTGIITTVSNPYFFLWWLTVGAGLIFKAARFSKIAVLIFAVIHILCDFLWYGSLTYLTYKTVGRLTPKYWIGIHYVSATMMLFFGIIFLVVGLRAI